MRENVLHLIECDVNDGESLPITRCLCGAKFVLWEEIVTMSTDYPWECPECGVKLSFSVDVDIIIWKES